MTPSSSRLVSKGTKVNAKQPEIQNQIKVYNFQCWQTEMGEVDWLIDRVSEWCDIKNVSLWWFHLYVNKKNIVLIYVCIPFAWRQLPCHPYPTTTVHAVSETTLPDHWIMNKSEAGFRSYSVFVFYSLRLHNSIQKTDPVWWPSGELLRLCVWVNVDAVIVHENRGLSR